MEKYRQTIREFIDAHSDLFIGVSDNIWEYAELSLKEFKSAALYCDVLREHGFEVREKLCGVPTAFCGSYGSGRPVIGILAEFDALDGLSQEAGVTEKKPLTPGGSGHGCNHNLLGAGSLAAAFAVKDYLERTGRPGTVVFFGCPGEEGGAGKAFMARDKAWTHLDAALTWHPETVNMTVSGSCLSCIQKEYIFEGISSHAAGEPENGRSALDAVELTNIGVQYLREHMPSTARIHYAITNAGGISPNVVQPYASVLYMVRDYKVHDVLALQERVDRIAQAAAMMTDTKLTIRFIDGCANTISNKTLEKLVYSQLCSTPLPVFSEEEQDYARKLIASYESGAPKSPAQLYDDILSEEGSDYVNQSSNYGSKAINDFVMPYVHSRKIHMGSSDVGDVSWQTPTVQFYTTCQPNGCPGHSWQSVSCGRSSLGYKGMLYAANVLASSAVELFENPAILEEARKEFVEKTQVGYSCPIPDDAVPTAL